MSRRAWVLIAVLVLAAACDRSGEVRSAQRERHRPSPPTVPTDRRRTVTSGPRLTAPNPTRPDPSCPAGRIALHDLTAGSASSVRPLRRDCATDKPLGRVGSSDAERPSDENPKRAVGVGMGHPTVPYRGPARIRRRSA